MTRTALLLPIIFLIALPVCAQSAGDVVISEIMPDPDNAPDGDGEYIELYNATSSDLSLQDWTLVVDGTGNDENDQLDDVTIPAKGFAVLCVNDDPTANGGLDNCALDYVNEISLNNGGSSVVLNDGSGTEIDRVEYDDGTNWPVVSGASMEFTGASGDDNNVAANWQEAMTRKGDLAGENGDLGSPGANASGGALPVELVDFDVAIEGQGATVSWTTASETNNAHFEVQHQGPSRAGYRALGSREGAGTTTQPQSYRFRVQNLQPGTHSFRLKQEDLDGTSRVGASRTVEVLPTSDLTLIGTNPLRAGESLTVVAKAPSSEALRIGLYNVLGQRIRTLASSSGGKVVRARVPTQDLSSGIYFVSTEGGAGGATARFTVVR